MNAIAYEVIGDARDHDWLQKRRAGIGASEAAALLDASPWISRFELYAQKVGAEPEKQEESEPMEWGKLLESSIVQGYRKRTGRPVDHGGKLLRSLRFPWALATLDAWTTDDEHSNGVTTEWWPLEIKNIGWREAAAWENGAPRKYEIQCAWQMLVTDKPRCTIAALVGGQRLIWQDVDRDPILERQLVRAAHDFWSHVERRDPPEPDGTESSARALAALYRETTDEPMILPGVLADQLDELDVIARELRELKERKAAAENAIKYALGAHQTGTMPDGRTVKWKYEERAGYTVEPSRSRVLRIQKAKKEKGDN